MNIGISMKKSIIWMALFYSRFWLKKNDGALIISLKTNITSAGHLYSKPILSEPARPHC